MIRSSPFARNRLVVECLLAALYSASIGAASARAEIPDRIEKLERDGLLRESRGRYEEALHLYLDELKALASLPAPDEATRREIGARGEVALSLADSLVRELDAWRLGDEALGEVLARPIDPIFRARAIVDRWTYQRSRSDVPEPPVTPAGLGSLTDWLLCGPFDNEQGGGFEREFPPEKELTPTATYDGKDRKATWRRVPVVGKASVDLAEVFTPNEQCLAYAWCGVRCEKETSVALRLATAEAVKVFVNGSAVYSRDVRRPRRFDQDAVGVKLPAGWSSILLKVTQRTGEWSLSARLTDPDGEPLVGVETTADPTVLASATFSAAKPETVDVHLGGLRTLADRVVAKPDDAWARFHLAVLLDFVKPLDAADTTALGHLREATRLAPKNPFFLFHRARASIRPAEMTPEREENAFRADLEALLSMDPDYAEAALELARYYLDTIDIPSRAEAYVARALATNPEFLRARLLERHVLELRDLGAQADAALNAIAKSPAFASKSAFLEEWIDHLRNRRRYSEARAACVRALLVDRRDAPALDTLTELYREAGEVDAAIAVLDEWIASEPYESSLLLRKAHLLDAYGRTDEAIGACARTVELNPQDDKRRQFLATFLHRAGRRDDAIAELGEARRLNPKDPWTERYLQFLRGEKRPFEEALRADPSEVAAKAKDVVAEKNEPFTYLLRDTLVKANADGTATRYEHVIAKILNPRGIVRFDRLPVPFAVSEQEVDVLVNRSIHPDGTTTQGRVLGPRGGSGDGNEYQTWSQTTIDPPALEVGDVVEIAFRVKDVKQSFFGDYFGYSHEFYAPDLAPVKESRFTLIRPKTRQVYLNVKNGAPDPTEGPGDEEGTVAYRFVLHDLPGVAPEPFMPPTVEFAPRVEATTYGSWDEFSSWWWNLIKNEFDSSDAMQAKVKELTAGRETLVEKARALYDFVVTDIRYEAWEFGVHGYKPYRTATVFDRGFGDCKDKAILLCTLFKEIGVKAVPVLIRAETERPSEDLSLPLVSHFNHCIAYAEFPDGPLYLDGTAQFHAMGTVPDMDRGAHVLHVDEGSAKLEHVPEAGVSDNVFDEGYDVTLRDDGSAAIRGAVQTEGTAAVETRVRYANPGRREDVISARFGDLFGKAHVTSSRFSDLRNLDEAARYSFELQVTDFLKRSGSERTAPLTFSPHSLRSFAALESRQFDLLLPPARTFRTKIRYRLPSGLTPVSLPESKSLETEFGHYRRKVDPDGADLVVESELSLSSRRVATAEYAAFREFCLQVSEAEEGILRLEPTTAHSTPK